MLERVALIAVLSMVLGTVPDLAMWHIACILGLVWAWGWLHWHEGLKDGTDLADAVYQAAAKTLEEAKQIVRAHELSQSAQKETQ